MSIDDNSTESSNLSAKIEALLFVYGDPISLKKIGSVLAVSEEDVRVAVEQLKEELETNNRGVGIIREGETVQLGTRAEFASFLEDIIKDEFTESLTPAGLETLAIIAYTAPATRAEIDYIRGVNSSFILRNLSLRGLIERSIESGKGNAYVYRPSFDLLKKLGISSVSDLPEFEKFKALVANFKESGSADDVASTDKAPEDYPESIEKENKNENE